MRFKVNLEPLIFALIFIVNLFWLPSFGLWTVAPSAKANAPNPPLSDYVHAAIPKVTSLTQPVTSAPNYILIDSATNTILASRNAKDRIYPASVTKLATALTALNIYSLQEIITVSQAYDEGKVMELQPGEKMTVQNLVQALLVYSANDAAYNLAVHHPKGTAGFIDQMNLIAKRYRLLGTHFTNFDGIHDPNHYSTVYDLSQIARLAVTSPIVTDTVKKKEVVLQDVDNQYQHQLTTTNELLGVIPEIEGLKTGWTPEARGCFVGLINLNGHYLISVVAQSDDRFADTKSLVDWAKANLIWEAYRP
jgi:D-alanyl-D-alanine carboxypeptidase (penicillin-binding protein 5/6)